MKAIKAIYKKDLDRLQKENAELLEALKLAKKIIHRQMGKGLVLSTKDYNKIFDPIKQTES